MDLLGVYTSVTLTSWWLLATLVTCDYDHDMGEIDINYIGLPSIKVP